eukprot:Nk52_evm1s868 gene=Nk52_evmTU1s868
MATDTESVALEVLTPATILFAVIIIIGNFCYVYKIRVLPLAAIAVAFGMGTGAFLIYVTGVDNILDEFVTFDPTFFTLALLPPVIFWSGYQVYRDDFYTELGTILIFAVFGTMVSVAVLGLGLYYSQIGELSVAESLMFGSLISAVDPVATLAVFGTLGVDPKLNIIVFGEAILNDAVSIVLYRTFEKFETGFSSDKIGHAFLEFFSVALGSTAIGLFVGFGTALILKWGKVVTNPIAETQLVFVLGLFSFYVAEGVELSGIISSFSSGIIMGMYADRNLSKSGRTFTHGFLETISSFADIIIFFKIGMSAFTYKDFDVDLGFAFFSLFLCLCGRAMHVFPFSFFMNLTRVQKIPWNHQVMMFHSGLRGAIAFSLAIGMSTEHKKEIVFATMLIAIFTVFVFGCTTSPMLKLLNIDVGIETTDNSCFSVHDKKRQVLLGWHKKYLRPFLLRKEILEEKELSKLDDLENDETISNLRSYHPELQLTVTGPVFVEADEEETQDTKFRNLLDRISHMDENQSTVTNLRNFLRRKKRRELEEAAGETTSADGSAATSGVSTPSKPSRRRRFLRIKKSRKRDISPASVTRFHKPDPPEEVFSDGTDADEDSVPSTAHGSRVDVRSLFDVTEPSGENSRTQLLKPSPGRSPLGGANDGPISAPKTVFEPTDMGGGAAGSQGEVFQSTVVDVDELEKKKKHSAIDEQNVQTIELVRRKKKDKEKAPSGENSDAKKEDEGEGSKGKD